MLFLFFLVNIVHALNESNITNSSNSRIYAPSPSFVNSTNQSYAPSPVNHSYAPSPVNHSYVPSPVNHSYVPSPVNHSYVPSPVNHSYVPSPVNHSYVPSPVNHSYVPSPVNHSYAPSPVNHSYVPSPVNRIYAPSPRQNYAPSSMIVPSSTKKPNSPSPVYVNIEPDSSEVNPNVVVDAVYFFCALGFTLLFAGGWYLKTNWSSIWVSDKHSFHEIEQAEELELSDLIPAEKKSQDVFAIEE